MTSGPAGPEEVVRDTEAPGAQVPAAADRPSAEGRPAPPPARRPVEDPLPAARPEPPTSPAAVPAEPPAPADADATEEATTPSRRPAGPQAQPQPPIPATPAAITDPESGVLLELPERRNRADSTFEEPAEDSQAEVPVESHAQQVPLPGGGAIELAGIAWSETGPFALINGRVVSPGATIEGYTLERIRPGHVVLAGDGRRIRLSLR